MGAATGQDPLVDRPREQTPFYRSELKAMWMIGWPMLITNFCRTGMMSMDSVFVGHTRSEPKPEEFFALPGLTAISWTDPAPRLNRTSTRDALEALLANPNAATAAWAYPEIHSVRAGKPEGTEDYLAAVALSDMLTSLLFVPLIAFSLALNPLVGQAMGSGNCKMAGTWLQLALFCLTMLYVPFLGSFLGVGRLLQLLGFDSTVSRLAGGYAIVSMVWPIPNSWFMSMRFYFQAQGKSRPAMYFALAFLGINALLSWTFIFGGPLRNLFGWVGMGFLGAAVAIDVSRLLQSFTYWFYMFQLVGAHRATWPGWSLDFLRRDYIRSYLAQAVPQVGTMLLSQIVNQGTTLMIARLGTLAVAASSSANATIFVIMWSLMFTLVALTSVRVGFHLGKGEPEQARDTAKLFFVVSASFGSFFAAFGMLFRRELMAIMTSDPEVRALGNELLPPLLLNGIASLVVFIGTGGVLAGQGRTRLSTMLSLGFELPFVLGTIAILVLYFHADVRIVYWGQAIVNGIEAIVVLAIIKRSDWELLSRQARIRQGAQPIEVAIRRASPGGGDPGREDCAEA